MTKQIFINRNEYGQKRDEFFKGIAHMLTEFTDEDIKRLRTIIFNELQSRKNKSTKDKGVIVRV